MTKQNHRQTTLHKIWTRTNKNNNVIYSVDHKGNKSSRHKYNVPPTTSIYGLLLPWAWVNMIFNTCICCLVINLAQEQKIFIAQTYPSIPPPPPNLQFNKYKNNSIFWNFILIYIYLLLKFLDGLKFGIIYHTIPLCYLLRLGYFVLGELGMT